MARVAGQLVERREGLHQVHVHVQGLVEAAVGAGRDQPELAVEVLMEAPVPEVRRLPEQQVEDAAGNPVGLVRRAGRIAGPVGFKADRRVTRWQ